MKQFLNVCLFCLLFSSGVVFADVDSKESQALNGTEITYLYSSGRSYHVKFAKEGLSYRYLTGSKPNSWWGPFPYQAMEVKEQLYFASWFEKGYGDYVTLLINLTEKELHGSAIIRGEEVHFHRADIIKIDQH